MQPDPQLRDYSDQIHAGISPCCALIDVAVCHLYTTSATGHAAQHMPHKGVREDARQREQICELSEPPRFLCFWLWLLADVEQRRRWHSAHTCLTHSLGTACIGHEFLVSPQSVCGSIPSHQQT